MAELTTLSHADPPGSGRETVGFARISGSEILRPGVNLEQTMAA